GDAHVGGSERGETAGPGRGGLVEGRDRVADEDHRRPALHRGHTAVLQLLYREPGAGRRPAPGPRALPPRRGGGVEKPSQRRIAMTADLSLNAGQTSEPEGFDKGGW